MNATILLEAQVQEKRMYSLLNEVMDLTTQLAQSVDRDDQVTLSLLLGMRAESMEKLKAVRRALEDQRDSLEAEDRFRLAELLNGDPADQDEEKALADQVCTNQRLLSRIIACDERVSRKLANDSSIYK